MNTLKQTTLAIVLTVVSTGSAALAQGVMPMAPVTAPPVTVSAPVMMKAVPSEQTIQANMAKTYRQVRAFWLSRAIVK